MNDLNENSNEHLMTTQSSKSHWSASSPYPVWPFGTVCPKELSKWGKRNLSSDKQLDSYEEALI